MANNFSDLLLDVECIDIFIWYMILNPLCGIGMIVNSYCRKKPIYMY
jgi:hypothetical protein